MRTSSGDVDTDRLCDAMRRARLSLQRYRTERVEAVRQYVGSHWSEEGSSRDVPVNLISLYVSVVGKNLLAKNPRVMLSTFEKSMKPLVSAMESWANERIESMHMAQTLQRIVIDALFSIGIAKVSIASPEDSARVAWRMDAGTPMVDRIDLDDFVFDVHARSFEEVGFIGHRYRVPLAVAKADKRFSKQRKDLTATPDELYNLEGDERINVMGRGVYASNYEEFEPFVSLWEVYLPRHKAVITLHDDHLTGAGVGKDAEPLCVQRWLGPDCGPYHILGLGIVPGNAMPKAPIQDLRDPHEAVNNIYRKSIAQAERQKDLLLVAGGATEDGNRIMSASDGDIIRSDRPEASHPATFGGVNAGNLQFGIHLKDLFSYLGGNIDMMGGLSPQSKTLGQDQLLAQNASRAVADMQDSTVSFTAEVLWAMCWFWYHHPTAVMTTEYSIPGMPQFATQRKVTPQQRQQARFEDMKVKVDPYSIKHQTPEGRLAAINNVVTQIVIPMQPILQQQGIMFDLNIYLSKVAKYLDEPDLIEMLTVSQPPEAQGDAAGGGAGPGMAQPGKPGQTTRNYVRRSLGGDTAQARDSNLVNTLAGAGRHNMNGQPAGAN